MKIWKKNEKSILNKKIHNIKFCSGKKNPEYIFWKKNLRTVSSFPLESGAFIWCRKQLPKKLLIFVFHNAFVDFVFWYVFFSILNLFCQHKILIFKIFFFNSEFLNLE